MKHQLDYMPTAHRRVGRRWPLFIVMMAFTAVLFMIAAANGIWELLLFTAVIGSACLWGLVHDLWTNGRFEWVLEGRVLRFRRPQDRGWGTIQVDDVEAVLHVQMTVKWNEAFYLVFVFRNGCRLYLEDFLFGTFGDTGRFARAIREVRPDLDAEGGDGSRCHDCDRLLVWSGDRRCPDCGASLPRPVPPIPAEGVLLPKGLAWL
jgi:hypothetical protein